MIDVTLDFLINQFRLIITPTIIQDVLQNYYNRDYILIYISLPFKKK